MNTYASDYIRRATTQLNIEAPDPLRANGTREVLESLYNANQSGDLGKAKSMLENIRKDDPTLIWPLGFCNPRWTLSKTDNICALGSPMYLYKNEILEGSLHVLYGASGVGKSFVALDYAYNIAQEHTVIYFATEGFRGYADRGKAWMNHNQKGQGELFYTETPIELLNYEDVSLFISEMIAQGIKPALIVLDTLAWCLAGGDENSAKDMQKAMNNCRLIQKELGSAILLVHHTGKNGGAERGSSALRGAADMLIKLEQRDDTLVLSCEKCKDDAPFEDRYLKLITVDAREGRTSCVPVPANKVVATPDDNLSRNQHKILEFVGLEMFHEGGVYSRRVKEQFPEIGSVYNVLNKLTKLGYVDHGGKGDPFKITPAGLRKLGKTSSNPNDSSNSHSLTNDKK